MRQHDFVRQQTNCRSSLPDFLFIPSLFCLQCSQVDNRKLILYEKEFILIDDNNYSTIVLTCSFYFDGRNVFNDNSNST